MEKHPLHLKSPEFQTSPEVNKAVKRQERVTGERVANDPSERIEAYMDRLEDVFLHPDEEKRERALDGHLFGAKESLREKIHGTLIIKKENFPDSYFELQKRVARERGQAVEEISDEVRERMMDVAIADQKTSLDAWIDYLSGPDAVYPAWFKYYAFTQVTKLSQFDKERGEFKKRTSSTVAPFPDIYREPLAQLADLYGRVKKNNKDSEARREFDKKFPTLYAELTQTSLASSLEHREQIEGVWVKYKRGNSGDAQRLYTSLQNKGTGWCTAGMATAEEQIESGDFYAYYTNDESGQPTQPRLAIRMEERNQIAEVRGILPHQNVEPILQDKLDEKLKEFGSKADMYRKKSSDMSALTAIEKKMENNQPLTRADLSFLYEVSSSIEGFGYEKDPRIEELRSKRNPDEDMLMIFDCTKDQIAHVPNEIGKSTKAYVGQLEPGIFNGISQYHIEHVYTSFPEGRIRMETIQIGGKSEEQLRKEIKSAGMWMGYSRRFGESVNDDLPTSKTKEEVHLARLTVADLGFKKGGRIEGIYKRAQELGLELCPAEVGPYYRLHCKGQSMGEFIYIGIEQIAGFDRESNMFRMVKGGYGVGLEYQHEEDSHSHHPDDQFLFSVRKPLIE
jgi:hypothetical protein